MAAIPYEEIVNLAGGLIGSTIGAIATLAPTQYDKARKKRIQTLEGLRDSGELGLSDAQLAEIEVLSNLGSAGAEKEFYSRQADVLRTSETTPQAIRLGQQAALESLRAQRSEASRAVMGAERQAEAEQLGELTNLQAEEKARQDEKKAAVAKFLSAGLISAGQATNNIIAENRLRGNDASNSYATPNPNTDANTNATRELLRKQGYSEDAINRMLGALGQAAPTSTSRTCTNVY